MQISILVSISIYPYYDYYRIQSIYCQQSTKQQRSCMFCYSQPVIHFRSKETLLITLYPNIYAQF